MKPLNIPKMIEDSVKTGEPVTESFMLGARGGEDEKSPVIDIEPVGVSYSPPQLMNPSGSKLGQRDCRQSSSVRDRSVGTRASCLSTKSVSPSISPEVKSILAKIDGSGLPSDFCSSLNAGIYRALVEYYFSLLPAGDKIQKVRELGYDVNRIWPISGRWNVVKGQEYDSIITLAVMLLIRDRNKAALVVGSLLGIKPEYCFRTYPQKDDIPSALPLHNPQVREQIPKQLLVLGRNYELNVIHYMQDFRGNKEHAICYYVDSADPQNSFFLPATRVEVDGNPMLTIGMVPVPARLYARAQMAQLEGATVLLCQNMRVAMELSRIANGARLFEREGIIISGCYGGATAFPALKFDDLAGHDVVLLLEPTRESLIDAPSLAKRCVKAGGASVSIYPWPVTAGDDLVAAEAAIRAQWKKDLWAQSVRVEDIELPSKFALDLKAKSIPALDYPEWLKDNVLISAAPDDMREIKKEIQFLSIDDLPDGLEQPDIPTWDDLITSWYLTFIWGVSNAGKSLVAVQIVIAIMTCTDAFGIFSISKRLVAYLDGEIGSDFKRRCLQLLKGNVKAQELLRQYLRVLPPSSGINLLDDACAEEIVSNLLEMKAQVLVIDNIFALAPAAVNSNVKKLFSFIHKVKQAGIAVIIIHHSGKDGATYKGPAELQSLSQNVIKLEGRDQLVEQGTLSPEVKKACNAGGAVTKITVEECKAAPLLEQKTAIYHLPKGGVWTHLEGDLVPTIDLDPLPAIVSAESEENSAIPVPEDKSTIHDLTPDEEKVCVALKGRNYKRAELETLTGFKTDKLGGILRRLVARGLVTKAGVGKATCYKCG
jgi:hypothetical protein